MPAINVFGVSDSVSESTLETVAHALQTEVAKIPELKLQPENISVFFPPNRLKIGLGEEVIAIVEGLYEREERTRPILNKLAAVIGSELRKHFPESLVECFIHTIDLMAGRWSSAD